MLVEAVYRLDLPDQDCARELAEAVGRTFARGAPVAASVAQAKNPGVFLSTAGDPAFVDAVAAAARKMTRAVWSFQPDFYDPLQKYRNFPDALAQLSALGAKHAWGFWCPTGRETAFQVFTFVDKPKRSVMAPRSSPRHREVATHLATGWRLRQALKHEPLATPEAVFSPDGAPMHLEGAAMQTTARDILRRIVRERERRRSARAHEEEPLWPALVRGRWTLVDQVESDGRRLVVACRNAAVRPRLYRKDHIILHRALEGEANKVIASDLHLSESQVSRRICHILATLRVADLLEAMKLSHILARRVEVGSRTVRDQLLIAEFSPDAEEVLARLPKAEAEVLTAIARGLTHAQIASERGAALQTIANQVTSAFDKLGISGRRELQCMLSSDPEYVQRANRARTQGASGTR
jgi:DNA-binding NarL/FixJ family response regulator